MNKILFGIPAMFPPRDAVNEKGFIEDYDVADPNADIWCDFSLEYYTEDNLEYSYGKSCYYSLGFETMLGFENREDVRNWLKTCFNCLTDYMNRHGYDTNKELDLYQVFTEGINVNSQFDSVEDAYAFLKFAINGFHGDALMYSQS